MLIRPTLMSRFRLACCHAVSIPVTDEAARAVVAKAFRLAFVVRACRLCTRQQAYAEEDSESNRKVIQTNMSTTARDAAEAISISGVMIPDTKLAREATELVRDTEPPLLFNHSTRVYYFGSLAGKRRGLKFDSELLYVGAMFHDMGLTPKYSSKADRFEVDGANSARVFLHENSISPQDIDVVWTAIALHTTPGNSKVHASRCCVGHCRRGHGCTGNRIL